MKRRQPIPLWLRRLDLVKSDLKGWRFPRNAEEGLQQCLSLSAFSLKMFDESFRHAHPRLSPAQLRMEKRRLLARFARSQAELSARLKANGGDFPRR